MRIFYFNITYGCNSNCIFCYSHNTRHGSATYNEIDSKKFFDYLEQNALSFKDRVIINGGEPFLHSEIDEVLLGLMKYNCEVLIYTNGRSIIGHDLSALTNKFRFIMPIHGYEILHDRITGITGSYQETMAGIDSLMKKTKCLVDIKIIINKYMILEDYDGKQLIESLKYVKFNNAVHITKMADTIVSQRNHCESVTNQEASYYTNLLYVYYKKSNRKIKLFDTCIRQCGIENYEFVEKYVEPIVVYFKDKNQFREMELKRSPLNCRKNCNLSDRCMTAVDEYKVLEYYNGIIYENLE